MGLHISELMVSKAPRRGPGAPGRLSAARAAGFGTPRTFGRGRGERSVPSGLASRS